MAETRFDMKKQDYMSLCKAYLTEELSKRKVNQKALLKAELLCEEAILKVAQYAREDTTLSIRIRRSIGGTYVEIQAKGEEIPELFGDGNISYAAKTLESSEEDIDTGLLILVANEKHVKYSNNNGTNLFKITVGKSEQSTTRLTLYALAVSIVIGVIFKLFVPEFVNTGLCTYIFVPIRTMFMNALKIVVGPVVFFSIVTCISQFTNLSELGKIGVKVICMYMLTTLIAIVVGFGMFFIINPGMWGGALIGNLTTLEPTVSTGVAVSILSTIINIIPANIVRPFLESDTLQIIFLAILLGAAVGMIGSYSKIVRDLFEAFNELFLTVTTLITKLIPLVLFSSMFIMLTTTGFETMKAMFGMALTDVLALSCMMVVYGILILLIGRLNPFTFFRKNLRGMLNAFSLSSSSASMPVNIKICTDDLGISPKVCNFSIPLGATINMDGVSVHLAVASMFLAKMYGVEVPHSMALSIIITIVMLSLGTPSVTGASLVCLGILLDMIGVPMEAIGLIIGVDSLLDMFRTVSNTTGDIAVTLIVAKMEKLLDIDVYKS
ncbi:dicarboxylate/amino acid:cation symporter [Butyrivibrio sp. FC2001]|uniref:dicarboxylate/amino acid:cation symporter n=1 Tax=Butyrivibrio sp. FC2001 TaxID=1280671 RepID=UPI0003FAC459|nr:dicarboxylate/amino acid:cation symporter [Butyrivibrio sp. FC2001]